MKRGRMQQKLKAKRQNENICELKQLRAELL